LIELQLWRGIQRQEINQLASTETTTGKPQINESEGTKLFVLYSRGFVIAGTFYYKINY
jgi:hypothetical protein